MSCRIHTRKKRGGKRSAKESQPGSREKLSEEGLPVLASTHWARASNTTQALDCAVPCVTNSNNRWSVYTRAFLIQRVPNLRIHHWKFGQCFEALAALAAAQGTDVREDIQR